MYRFVILFALAVVIDWMLGEPFIHRIQSNWVTMKFATAILFILMSLCVAAQDRIIRDGLALIVITYSLASLFVGTGPEELSPVSTVKPGVPSIATIGCFVAIAFATATGQFQRIVKCLVLLVAATCIGGYVTGIREFTWDFPEASTAMAFSTAICFALLAWDMDRSQGSEDFRS